MSNSSRNIEMITKITLENYPSRNEVLTLLDVFLSDNNYPKDYSVSNKDSMLVILFKKPEIAFDFIKRINIEKLDNHLYSKLRTNMSVEAVRPEGTQSHVNTSASVKKPSKSKALTMKYKVKKGGYDKPLERKCIHKSSSSITCSILASSPYLDRYEEMKKEMHENKSKWIVNRNFNGYIGKATYNRKDSSPGFVIKTPSIPFIFRKSDKAKWISPKGFFV